MFQEVPALLWPSEGKRLKQFLDDRFNMLGTTQDYRNRLFNKA
jgi:hypothetical protein